MCLDNQCPMREHCLRFTAKANAQGWQSYADFYRAPGADKCADFLANGSNHYAKAGK